MELNLVMAIIDRERTRTMETICQNMKMPMILTMLCRGTATVEHLSLYGLVQKDKAIISTIADREQTQKLMRAAKLRMFIDIPGNGVMLSIPIKSVGGRQTMAYLTDKKTLTGEKPKMDFPYELIYVILNEGASDTVMQAARSAGATGGTVLLGKGTGSQETGKFLGISLASEKDVVLILSKAEQKASIMKAIVEQAGPQTDAGAICFSLPVSQVAGLRTVDADEYDNAALSEEPAAEKA